MLDGVDDPSQTFADSRVKQVAAIQEAFEAYAADCAAAADCPLGADPARATAVYQQLTRPLLSAPAPADGTTRLVSYTDVTEATRAALYNPAGWPVLTAALRELQAGKATTFLAIADSWYGRSADGDYGNYLEVTGAIACVDYARSTDRAAAADLQRRVAAAAPYADSGQPAVGVLDVCALWSVPVTSIPHVPMVEGLPQVLAVSVTGDPATPYQAGVDIAKAIDAQLLTVAGNQHGAALQGDACVDTIVLDYLEDLTLPADGARCTLPGYVAP